MFSSTNYGSVAEWLGRALQKLLQRFESARDLQLSPGNGGFYFKTLRMKYAHVIGFLASAAVVLLVFQPWIFIPSVQLTISGWSAEGTDFGKPGLVPLVFSAIMCLLFWIPKVGAKVTTIILATLQLAWMMRNYILLTTSYIGEIPEKQWALIVLVPLTGLVLVMSLLSRNGTSIGDKG
jgi:hypothetical protein